MTDLAVEALRAADDLHLALSGVALPGPWLRHGRCRTAPANLFFPGRGDDVDQARAICARCLVMAACREYAPAAGADLQGVWGGTTSRERRHLRATRDAMERRPAEETTSRAVASPSGSLLRTLTDLTAHPGRWARVARFASVDSAAAMASRARTGDLLVPPGRWVFEGRRNDADGSDLYALYEPPAEAFDDADEDDVAIRRLLGLEAS